MPDWSGIRPAIHEIAVPKAGDKCFGERGNEFGYANYEMIPAVTELAPIR